MRYLKSALFLLVPTFLWAAHLHRPYSFYPQNLSVAGVSATPTPTPVPTSTPTPTPTPFPETNGDSNVVGLWYFDEPSGNIVDEISAFSVTQRSSPTYSQTSTGSFSAISPGISCTGGHFYTSTTPTQLAPGTGSQTLEIYLKIPASSVDGYLYLTDILESDGVALYLRSSDHTIRGALVGPVDVVAFNFATTAGFWGDGLIHKFRVVFDRSAANLITVREDGVSLGTANIAVVAGEDVIVKDLHIGGYSTGSGSRSNAVIYTLRVSNSNSANLGGPGGG